MTLQEINASAPELRAAMSDAFNQPNARLLLDAMRDDIMEGLDRKPVVEAGEAPESAIARWHSFLAGRRDVLRIIANIGKERARSAKEERPFEHAIPNYLRPKAEQPTIP